MLSKMFSKGEKHSQTFFAWLLVIPVLMVFVSLACSRLGAPTAPPWTVSNDPFNYNIPQTALARGTLAAPLPVTLTPGGPEFTPTPDAPHPLPTQRIDDLTYTVQRGDSLSAIARQYQISLETLASANNIVNPNLIEPGQVLLIPRPESGSYGSGFKIIPDSELVYGPAVIGFDIEDFVSSQGGYLQRYEEELDGETYTGEQVVIRVSQEYSVNPRLLLAVLDYRSGWVTQSNPDQATLEQPVVRAEAWRTGLYLQLAWAANQLNSGYYRWRVNSVVNWILSDSQVIAANPTINAGTAAVQSFFATLLDRSAWETAVSEQGLYAVYIRFFGFPFARSIEPLIPPGLVQPALQLPFEPGVVWSFTGGPHGGWAEGSAWAALDFAPPDGERGCIQSDAWVTAVADGLVVRTGNGAVVQDLDFEGLGGQDGYEQTGWTVLYMHVESRDRVATGSYLQAGDRIGHPSCEGGFSQATHLHLARRYNGEWISTDRELPLILDGWVSRGAGQEYDGFLMKDGMEIEAWNAYRPESTIQR